MTEAKSLEERLLLCLQGKGDFPRGVRIGQNDNTGNVILDIAALSASNTEPPETQFRHAYAGVQKMLGQLNGASGQYVGFMHRDPDQIYHAGVGRISGPAEARIHWGSTTDSRQYLLVIIVGCSMSEQFRDLGTEHLVHPRAYFVAARTWGMSKNLLVPVECAWGAEEYHIGSREDIQEWFENQQTREGVRRLATEFSIMAGNSSHTMSAKPSTQS